MTLWRNWHKTSRYHKETGSSSCSIALNVDHHHKISDFIKKHKKSSSSTSGPPPVIQNIASTFERDIFRYRKQRGVNLGSWFVLERWIAEEPFRSAAHPAQSDLDIAKGDNARQILEHHWDSWIVEEDWDFMSQHGINTVRIPIGYYHLSSPDAISGTEFSSFGSVYEGAWARISAAIGTAYRRGIGVLIDLHAAPGKQNHDSHGGTSGEPQFFSHRSNMHHATNILCILLRQIQELGLPNVVGVELLNEPSPPSVNGDPLLQGWYTDTIRRLQAIDPLMPIVLGECWRADSYADYLTSPEMEGIRASGCIVALDHHLYRCFTNEDIHTHISEHARRLKDPNDGTPSMFARISDKLGKALIVGEWSAALNPGSMNGVHSEDEAKREYVHAQLQLYEQYTAGWFFWTYKKSGGRDTGWGWRDAVQAGAFPAWVGLQAPSSPAQNDAEQREHARNKAQADHEAYWNQYPGDYEHWRLSAGFTTGWNDAYAFFAYARGSGAPLPELGYKGAWAKRRAAEHAREHGTKSLWEFEHGISQGIDAARADFVVRYGGS